MAVVNIIKVDNGYYETISDSGGGIPVTSWNVGVYIWEGDVTSNKPLSPTLSLTIVANETDMFPDPDSRVGYFDLGRYVQPYLEFLPKDGNYQKGVWVQYETRRNNYPLDPVVTGLQLFALLGANRYEKGETNYFIQDVFNGVVMGCNSNELTCSPDSSLIAPVFVGGVSTNAKIVTSTQSIDLTSLGATLNSDDSGEQIFYVPLNENTFGSEWQEGKSIKYFITDSDGQPYLEGIEFDGISTYMDLGIVPMLNSSDSYVKLTFKATNYGVGNNDWAFGYDNNFSSGDLFQMRKQSTMENYFLLSNVVTTVNPSDYPNPDSYQEFRVYDSPISTPSLPTLNVEIGGYLVADMEDVDYVRKDYSGLPFYLGARNNMGVAENFTNIRFTEAEFFNGTELKIFNAANNWGGATNYGGVKVYSTDGGNTWTTEEPQNEYCLRIKCFKGEATALRYYNCEGVLIDIPINGRVTESETYNKKTFNNFTLDNDGGWNPTIHSNKPYLSNGKELYLVHTGWVKESVNDMIKDLLISKAVWIIKDGLQTPVVVTDNQKKFINRLWEKEVGYSINLEASNKILL